MVFPTHFYLIPFQGSSSGTITYVGQGLIQPCQSGTYHSVLWAPLAWLVPLLGGITGARTYKVISTSRQKNLPRSHWAAGKEEAVCCSSRCKCGSHPSEDKRACSCRKKACKMGLLRQEGKNLESSLLDGFLDSISIYFLRCNTTCRPQSRAGRSREKMVL